MIILFQKLPDFENVFDKKSLKKLLQDFYCKNTVKNKNMRKWTPTYLDKGPTDPDRKLDNVDKVRHR